MSVIANLWWLWVLGMLAAGIIAGVGTYRIHCIDRVSPEGQAEMFFETLPYLGAGLVVLACAVLAILAGIYHLTH